MELLGQKIAKSLCSEEIRKLRIAKDYHLKHCFAGLPIERGSDARRERCLLQCRVLDFRGVNRCNLRRNLRLCLMPDQL